MEDFKDIMKNIKTDLVILLVEDNQYIRQQVSEGLSKIFSTVLTAPDGEYALKILNTIYVDVVISDINMPNMNGIDLIKAIRKGQKIKPIIITTAYDDFKQVYKDMPNISLLVKPYTIYEVIRCINESESLIEANKQNEDSFERLQEVSNMAKDILKQLKG